MYGRSGDLSKLNKDRNDYRLSKFTRSQANKAYAKIVSQLKDKKLMRLRLRLIGSTKAGDLNESTKIEQQMRSYIKQDRETGT